MIPRKEFYIDFDEEDPPSVVRPSRPTHDSGAIRRLQSEIAALTQQKNKKELDVKMAELKRRIAEREAARASVPAPAPNPAPTFKTASTAQQRSAPTSAQPSSDTPPPPPPPPSTTAAAANGGPLPEPSSPGASPKVMDLLPELFPQPHHAQQANQSAAATDAAPSSKRQKINNSGRGDPATTDISAPSPLQDPDALLRAVQEEKHRAAARRDALAADLAAAQDAYDGLCAQERALLGATPVQAPRQAGASARALSRLGGDARPSRLRLSSGPRSRSPSPVGRTQREGVSSRTEAADTATAAASDRRRKVSLRELQATPLPAVLRTGFIAALRERTAAQGGSRSVPAADIEAMLSSTIGVKPAEMAAWGGTFTQLCLIMRGEGTVALEMVRGAFMVTEVAAAAAETGGAVQEKKKRKEREDAKETVASHRGQPMQQWQQQQGGQESGKDGRSDDRPPPPPPLNFQPQPQQGYRQWGTVAGHPRPMVSATAVAVGGGSYAPQLPPPPPPPQPHLQQPIPWPTYDPAAAAQQQYHHTVPYDMHGHPQHPQQQQTRDEATALAELQEVGVEGTVPDYEVVLKPAVVDKALGRPGLGAAAAAARAARPFASALLAPAPPPRAARADFAAALGLRLELGAWRVRAGGRWLTALKAGAPLPPLPADGGQSLVPATSSSSNPLHVLTQALAKFQETMATGGATRGGSGGGGGSDGRRPAALAAALAVLDDGLKAHPSSELLLTVRLQLQMQTQLSPADAATAAAATAASGSYHVWLAAGAGASTPFGAAMALHAGAVALAAPAAKAAAAGAVLDLELRALRAVCGHRSRTASTEALPPLPEWQEGWTAPDSTPAPPAAKGAKQGSSGAGGSSSGMKKGQKQSKRAAEGNGASKRGRSSGSQEAAAAVAGRVVAEERAAIEAALDNHPVMQAVLYSSLAFAAVHGRLPTPVEHRLGVQQAAVAMAWAPPAPTAAAPDAATTERLEAAVAALERGLRVLNITGDVWGRIIDRLSDPEYRPPTSSLRDLATCVFVDTCRRFMGAMRCGLRCPVREGAAGLQFVSAAPRSSSWSARAAARRPAAGLPRGGDVGLLPAEADPLFAGPGEETCAKVQGEQQGQAQGRGQGQQHRRSPLQDASSDMDVSSDDDDDDNRGAACDAVSDLVAAAGALAAAAAAPVLLPKGLALAWPQLVPPTPAALHQPKVLDPPPRRVTRASAGSQELREAAAAPPAASPAAAPAAAPSLPLSLLPDHHPPAAQGVAALVRAIAALPRSGLLCVADRAAATLAGTPAAAEVALAIAERAAALVTPANDHMALKKDPGVTWALAGAAGALAAARPPAAAELWARAVALTARVPLTAAAELAERAIEAHPVDEGLRMRMRAAVEAGAAAAGLGPQSLRGLLGGLGDRMWAE